MYSSLIIKVVFKINNPRAPFTWAKGVATGCCDACAGVTCARWGHFLPHSQGYACDYPAAPSFGLLAVPHSLKSASKVLNFCSEAVSLAEKVLKLNFYPHTFYFYFIFHFFFLFLFSPLGVSKRFFYFLPHTFLFSPLFSLKNEKRQPMPLKLTSAGP